MTPLLFALFRFFRGCTRGPTPFALFAPFAPFRDGVSLCPDLSSRACARRSNTSQIEPDTAHSPAASEVGRCTPTFRNPATLCAL